MISNNNSVSSFRILHLLLLRSNKYSFLPELLDEVGEETMYKLLQIFAGIKIEFPSIKKLEQYAREITIYERLNKASNKNKAMVVNNLCEEYNIDNDTVWVIYRKVSVLSRDAFGIKIRYE
jgi:hypothetical protein